MLDLRSLRHVLALHRYQHFGRAAEALHISQSALSQSISAIEQSLGVALFERGAKGVRPTRFGELLIERGAKLLVGASELQRDLVLMQGKDVSDFRVAAGVYSADLLIGDALARLSMSRPGLRINVTIGNYLAVARAVREERVEVGIADLVVAAEYPGLETLELRSFPFVIACRAGHPLAGRNDVQLSDIVRYPLVGPPLPSPVAARLPAAYAAGRRDVASGDFYPTIAIDSPKLALQIAAASDALFPVPAEWLGANRQNLPIEVLNFQEHWMRADHGIIWLRERPLSPAAAEFMKVMRGIADTESAASER